MNKNLAFDFIVNKDNNTISIKREFAAELPVIWDAYTKSEFLDLWWAPKPWKARTKSMDFSEGGTWLYAMVGPEGQEHWAVATYKDVQPQKSFSGIDAFSDSDGNINDSMPKSKWDVIFTDKGDITLVEFNITYPDLAQLEATINMGFREGITMAMEGLDDLLPQLKNK